MDYQPSKGMYLVVSLLAFVMAILLGIGIAHEAGPIAGALR